MPSTTSYTQASSIYTTTTTSCSSSSSSSPSSSRTSSRHSTPHSTPSSSRSGSPKPGTSVQVTEAAAAPETVLESAAVMADHGSISTARQRKMTFRTAARIVQVIQVRQSPAAGGASVQGRQGRDGATVEGCGMLPATVMTAEGPARARVSSSSSSSSSSPNEAKHVPSHTIGGITITHGGWPASSTTSPSTTTPAQAQSPHACSHTTGTTKLDAVELKATSGQHPRGAKSRGQEVTRASSAFTSTHVRGAAAAARGKNACSTSRVVMA